MTSRRPLRSLGASIGALAFSLRAYAADPASPAEPRAPVTAPAPAAPGPSGAPASPAPPAADASAPPAGGASTPGQPQAQPPAPATPAPATPAPATPAPATPTPAPAAPAPAPAATQSPDASTQGQGEADRYLRFAFVQLLSDYPNTTLELSSFADGGAWKKVCVAPCERELLVEGAEARVSAPGMTTSNVFRIEPGRGRALIKVDGGSGSAQRWGLTGLLAGIPVTMLGMVGFGYGALADQDELKIAGGITLGVGAAMLLTSLPLLLVGGTDVRDGKGRQIAEVETGRATPAW